jgi:Flp pilus assembly pilin Flp
MNARATDVGDVGKGRHKFKLTEMMFGPPNRTVTGLAKLAGDDAGATAVEYGLILGGIAALIIVSVFLLGGKTNGLFQQGLWP